MATAFVHGLPADQATYESISVDEWRQRHPFVSRSILVSLDLRFAENLLLTEVEYLVLPFNLAWRLWRLTFARKPKEPAPSPEAEKTAANAAPAKPIHALALEFEGIVTPVDYTDYCFAEAIFRAHSPLTIDTPEKRKAYLAVYFAVSYRVRDRDTFYPSFRTLNELPGVDATKWNEARERAGRHVGADQDAYVCVSRRSGIVKIFRDAYRTIGGFARVIPTETNELVLFQQDDLITDDERPPIPWWPRVQPTQSMTVARRRHVQGREEEDWIRRYRKWCPDGFEAHKEQTRTTAREMYEERRRRFPWRQVLPSPDPETPDEVGLRAETAEFLSAVQARCDDYAIPVGCIEACRAAGGARHDLVLDVRRRELPFYPAHRLFEVIDRRGGRTRRLRFLFAPESATELPAELDRLIPLNDVSDTLHMINHAYKPQLTGLNAVEYLSFFSRTISGGDGVFHTIEALDDVRWRGQAVEHRRRVEELATPIRLWPTPDGEVPVLDAVLTYAGALFHAEFRLPGTGVVQMVSDRGLVERLDIAPEVVSAGTHIFLRQPRDFRVPDAWKDRVSSQ